MDGPLIVQSDKTLLLEVDHPKAEDCRGAVAAFAELERAPEHVHTYRITELGLWNARAAGVDAETVVDALITYARYPVPSALLVDVAETMARYGRLVLERSSDGATLVLRAADAGDQPVLEEAIRSKHVGPLVGARSGPVEVEVAPANRGRLKQALLKVGWPADDQAGHVEGAAHPISLQLGDGFELRSYQDQAVTSFFATGSGVVVLPCGAGKTIVGAAAMARAGARTLILVTNTVSARQWRRELLAKTSLTDDEIGEYSGERKHIRPVTIATYQILITKTRARKPVDGEEVAPVDELAAHPHFGVFGAEDWGLIIYDEVHLLPAPVFRMAADLQSRRRLGLTATLVREDGKEGDVFSLIGPKRYDAPWKDLEAQGWIAPARCVEVRVTLTSDERMDYALAEPQDAYRICSTAASKAAVVEALIRLHPGEPTLVIGQYLDHLDRLAARLDVPLLTGKTKNKEREDLYQRFRDGDIPVLMVSKVANFSIDLPDATVAIQVSGTFGSRQEEAQRLGRILRPKSDGRQATFYSVVSRDTDDQRFAANRQRFLAEQGYAYEIVDADEVLAWRPDPT